MKQALAVLSVLLVALLAVSGFIVAGSVEQSQQLTAKTSQLLEARKKLARCKAKTAC